MGYRSEICIAISNDIVIPENVNEALISVFTEPYITTKTTKYYYHDGIKWYSDMEGYEDITTIEDFISDNIDTEKVALLRIGEEYDDIQEYGAFWDFGIYLNRTITYPGNE